MSQDGGEPQLSIQGKYTLHCASKTELAHSLPAEEANWSIGAAQDREWCCEEQAGVGTGKVPHLPLPPLLFCLLSCQAQLAKSVFSLPITSHQRQIYFHWSSSASDAALTHRTMIISCFWGACFAAHYRQWSALFFSKASPATRSIPTKKCKYEEESTHLLTLQILLRFPSSMSSLMMSSFPEYTQCS